MSKGQKRSNREIKKPKKATSGAIKSAAVSHSSQPSGTSYKDRFRKTASEKK
jgi:hypothetical protein